MKAIFRKSGTKDSFTEILQERPIADKTSIILKVIACGLSPTHETVSDEFLPNDIHQVAVAREVTGVVTVVGADVTNVKVNDHVVGILRLSSEYSACGEYCRLQACDVVKKPDMLGSEVAAAGIGDCLRAYTALHYLGHVSAGDTVLVIDGASSCGYLVIQLAHLWGAKVITTVNSRNEYSFIERLQPPVAHIIEMGEKIKYLSSRIMEETGRLGVDCIIDNGAVQLFEANLTEKTSLRHPHKHDLLACLGVGGRWVTSQPDLQLDPPDCIQLYMRGASLCFLFDPVWTLTRSQQGRYQHILNDSVDKLAKGTIKPKIQKIVKFEEALKTLETLDTVGIGKVVVKM